MRNLVEIRSEKSRKNVDKLASQAQDLRDLLSKLEKQRMEKERKENNKVTLRGTIVSDELTFWYESEGEKFYVFYLSVRRLSETTDYIPIVLSEKDKK